MTNKKKSHLTKNVDLSLKNLGETLADSHLEVIPHVFRHFSDLLHLPTYTAAYEESALSAKWAKAEDKSYLNLTALLGFTSEAVIKVGREWQPAVSRIYQLAVELRRLSEGLAVDPELFMATSGREPKILENALVIDLLSPKGLLSTQDLLDFWTADKNLDNCLNFIQSDHTFCRDQILKLSHLMNKISNECGWLLYNRHPFSEIIPALQKARFIYFICKTGSDSSSAALHLRKIQDHLNIAGKIHFFEGGFSRFLYPSKTTGKT